MNRVLPRNATNNQTSRSINPFFHIIPTEEPPANVKLGPCDPANGLICSQSSLNKTIDYYYYTVFGIIELSEITVALLLNLALFIMIMNQRKIRNTKSCKLFLNLQLVHVLLLISNVIHNSYMGYNTIHVYINNGLLIQMFLSMVLATIDRLIAIKHPYVYGNIRTKQVVIGMICSWCPGMLFIIVAMICSPKQKYMTMVSTGLIGFSMLVLVSSNLCIFFIARKHWNDIISRCTQASFKGLDENKRLKSLYVCLSIVISFLVLWMPYFIHGAMLLVSGYGLIEEKFTKCVEVVAFANSIADPLLFVMFRKDARKEAKRVFSLKLTS